MKAQGLDIKLLNCVFKKKKFRFPIWISGRLSHYQVQYSPYHFSRLTFGFDLDLIYLGLNKELSSHGSQLPGLLFCKKMGIKTFSFNTFCYHLLTFKVLVLKSTVKIGLKCPKLC